MAKCTTLCDKVCQWLAICWWYSPVSSTNKTDLHGITVILLKVVLNTITLTYFVFVLNGLIVVLVDCYPSHFVFIPIGWIVIYHILHFFWLVDCCPSHFVFVLIVVCHILCLFSLVGWLDWKSALINKKHKKYAKISHFYLASLTCQNSTCSQVRFSVALFHTFIVL